MVRYAPEGIGTKLFRITEEENTTFWKTMIVGRLGVPGQKAAKALKRLRYDSSHITGAGDTGRMSLPAYEDAARLLATLSTVRRTTDRGVITVFDVDGPRGPRPIMASAASISSIRGGTTASDAAAALQRIRRAYGGIDEMLCELGLTASDIYSWKGRGLEYSHEDVRRGLFLPGKPDIPTARALGIIEADGHMDFRNAPYTRRLHLLSDRRDLELYRTDVPKVIERAFNLLQDEPYKTKRIYRTTGCKVPELRYTSKGLVAFLRSINFPSSRSEIHGFGFDEFVGQFDNKQREEFLRHFVPFASIFSRSDGSISMYHPSRKRAYELQELMKDFLGLSDVVKVQRKGGTDASHSFAVTLSRAPMRELYERGFFDLNPRLNNEIGSYIKGRYADHLPRASLMCDSANS